MLSRVPITFKMLGLVMGAILTTAITQAVITERSAAETSLHEEKLKLEALSKSNAANMKDYLDGISSDLDSVATNPATLSALRMFEMGWDRFGRNQTDTLQDLYIFANPHPLGEKHRLDAAGDNSAYSTAHSMYHPWFRDFLEARGYYDIFLFSMDGALVYTVFKEADYATNLRTGEWSNTDLGNAFRAAADDVAAGDHAFFDFQPYAPSHGAPASFISRIIPDEAGNAAGVLVFQMPIDRLNTMMGHTDGLGESGESFLVGSDGYLRTDAPRADESTILKMRVDAELLDSANSEIESFYEGAGYGGEDVVATATPVEFEGTVWHAVTQQNRDEILAPIRDLRSKIMWTSGALLIALSAIGAVLARMITSPITKIAKTTEKIADGQLSTDVPYRSNGDEIGQLARSLEKFRQAMVTAEQLAKEQQERAIQDKVEAERRAEMGERLTERARKFDEVVSAALGEFGSAAGNLDENATAMSAIAEETASQSSGIMHASQNASNNVQSVAAATEELSVSVGEISSKVSLSRDATANAVKQAEVMRQRVASLEEAASAISDVIELITNIAGQTNLLALNATIEAARAGEAGKGFAVVASEVKALATQTSKATEDISKQISAIQNTTTASVSGIHDILTVIGELESASTEIASAIEQQGCATQQISSSIQNAASSVTEVDSNIQGVNDAAQEAGVTANRMRSASETLHKQSEILRNEVMSFLSDVRAS